MSAKKAAPNPVRWKELIQVRYGSLVAGSRRWGSNFPFLSGSTKSLKRTRSEEAGRNTREPRSSLVNTKTKRATDYFTREANNPRSEPRCRESLPGYQGRHASKERERNLGDPQSWREMTYKSEWRKGQGALRESDKPILAMTPKTTKLWRAKGLDLNRVDGGRGGLEIGE